MDKITIDKEELVKIKIYLERTSNCWHHIMTLIDPCLTDNHRHWIYQMSNYHFKCLRKIDRILDSKADPVVR